MRLIPGYLARAVQGGFALSLFGLTAVFSFFALIAELSDLGQAGYGMAELFQYMILTTPRRAFELLPSAALVGALVGLGGLASAGELVALRAAGFSILAIGRMVLKATWPILLFAFLLGEFAVPPLERFGQEIRSRALNDSFSISDDGGVWARDGSAFVNVRVVEADRTLQQVTIYEFDQAQRLAAVTRAEQAVNVNDQWILENIRQTQLKQGHAELVEAPHAQWDSPLAPENMSVGVVEPQRMSIRELYRHASFLSENGQQAGRFELAFWQKIVQPLTVLVMVMISLPFVFGSLRSGNFGQRIFVGIVFGLLFHIVSQGIGYLGLAYGFNLMIAAVAPSLLFFFATLGIVAFGQRP